MADEDIDLTRSLGNDGGAGHEAVSGKRKREESNPSDVVENKATLFESGRQRLLAARRELDLAEENMENIRQIIRASGNYEPDSLLHLCDGEDNNILSYIMGYLAVRDIGRCEMVCRTLRLQSGKCWNNLDKMYFKEHPACRSPSTQSSRERVIRYQNASSLAERIGAIGNRISKHLLIFRYEDSTNHSRVHDCCDGCELPDLDFSCFSRGTEDYELFARFSRTSDNTLLAEGFLLETSFWAQEEFGLSHFNFSSWPQILEVNHLCESINGEAFADEGENHKVLADCLREITVIVISVHKGTSKASLVAAQSNFGDEPPENGPRSYGIDNGGDHGYCWPRGRLSCFSHGEIVTQNSPYRHSDIKLGMSFSLREQSNDPENVKCIWTLECILSLRDD